MKYLVFLAAIILIAGCTGQVPPTNLSVVSYNQSVNVGDNISITWAVNEPYKIYNYTAIQYGYETRQRVFSTRTSVQDSGYLYASAVQKGDIPGPFTVAIQAEKQGTLYFRALAIIDDNHFWSDEYSVEVLP